MIKIQNVVFNLEKNLIQICRGMKQVFLSITQGGVIVVKLKGYDRYYFCPDTTQVYSRKNSKTFEALKPRRDGAKVYYFLYKNGIPYRVYVWKILLDNMEGIETFLSERSLPARHLEIVS